MSDIVERLRVWPLRRGYSEVSIRRIMRDAADEIENLRAAIKMAIECLEDCDVIGASLTLKKRWEKRNDLQLYAHPRGQLLRWRCFY